MTHPIIYTMLDVIRAIERRGNIAPSKGIQRKAARLLGVPSQGFRPDLARIVYVAGDALDRGVRVQYPVALYLAESEPTRVAFTTGHVVPAPEIVSAECPCDHHGRLADEGDLTPHAMCSHVLTALTLAASLGYKIKTKED